VEIIDVPVARPRSQEQFLSGHFLATKKRLEELIHGPTHEPTSTKPTSHDLGMARA
jgi:hypothetical protein